MDIIAGDALDKGNQNAQAEEVTMSNSNAHKGEEIVLMTNGNTMILKIQDRTMKQIVFAAKPLAGVSKIHPYDAKNDSPAEGVLTSLQPTKEEVVEGTKTLECMIVGVVDATNPTRYSLSLSKSKKNKARNSEDKMQTFTAPQQLLRAVVLKTEFLTSLSNLKIYVLCNELHGSFQLRQIHADSVFYVEEFYEGLAEGLQTTERKSRILDKIRFSAADQPKFPPKKLIDQASHHEYVFAEDLAGRLQLALDLFKITKSDGTSGSLGRLIDTSLPDIVKMASDGEIQEFFASETSLEQDVASNIALRIHRHYPHMEPMSEEVIVKIHTSLVRLKLKGMLLFGNFYNFMIFLANRVTDVSSSSEVDLEVAKTIESLERMSGSMGPATTFPVAISHAKADFGPSKFILMITAAREILVTLAENYRSQVQLLRDHHERLEELVSLKELMERIGDCVDKDALKHLVEQAIGLGVDTLIGMNSGSLDRIEKVIEFFDKGITLAREGKLA